MSLSHAPPRPRHRMTFVLPLTGEGAVRRATVGEPWQNFVSRSAHCIMYLNHRGKSPGARAESASRSKQVPSVPSWPGGSSP